MSFADYIIRDYDKPLGVSTYKTSKEMSDDLLKALPPVNELKKLLDDTSNKISYEEREDSKSEDENEI